MTFRIWLNGYDRTHHSQMIWNSMTIELARFFATLNPNLCGLFYMEVCIELWNVRIIQVNLHIQQV